MASIVEDIHERRSYAITGKSSRVSFYSNAMLCKVLRFPLLRLVARKHRDVQYPGDFVHCRQRLMHYIKCIVASSASLLFLLGCQSHASSEEPASAPRLMSNDRSQELATFAVFELVRRLSEEDSQGFMSYHGEASDLERAHCLEIRLTRPGLVERVRLMKRSAQIIVDSNLAFPERTIHTLIDWIANKEPWIESGLIRAVNWGGENQESNLKEFVKVANREIVKSIRSSEHILRSIAGELAVSSEIASQHKDPEIRALFSDRSKEKSDCTPFPEYGRIAPWHYLKVDKKFSWRSHEDEK
jgi:hypothetical protein